MKKYYLAIDIGGTKTALGIFNEKLDLLEVVKLKTEPQKGIEQLLSHVEDTLKDMMMKLNIDKDQLVSAGIVCPGPLDLENGRIIHIATMGWQNIEIKQLFADLLNVPVYLENDCNGAGIGECFFGAGQGNENMVYITVSTGIGGALIQSKKLITGSHDASGEFGHICVERNGKLCKCGKKGCLEMYASGTAIEENAFLKTGKRMSAIEIMNSARYNDTVSIEIINRASDYLGYAISMIYQIVDPDIVVIGGGVANDFDLLYPHMIKCAIENTNAAIADKIKIVPHKLKGLQGLYGAAYLVQRNSIADSSHT